jgi:hypothetical protein
MRDRPYFELSFPDFRTCACVESDDILSLVHRRSRDKERIVSHHDAGFVWAHDPGTISPSKRQSTHGARIDLREAREPLLTVVAPESRP